LNDILIVFLSIFLVSGKKVHPAYSQGFHTCSFELSESAITGNRNIPQHTCKSKKLEADEYRYKRQLEPLGLHVSFERKEHIFSVVK